MCSRDTASSRGVQLFTWARSKQKFTFSGGAGEWVGVGNTRCGRGVNSGSSLGSALVAFLAPVADLVFALVKAIVVRTVVSPVSTHCFSLAGCVFSLLVCISSLKYDFCSLTGRGWRGICIEAINYKGILAAGEAFRQGAGSTCSGKCCSYVWLRGLASTRAKKAVNRRSEGKKKYNS
jgi:hypothetical protein